MLILALLASVRLTYGALTVTWPVENSRWDPGQLQTIKWDVTPSGSVSSVDIRVMEANDVGDTELSSFPGVSTGTHGFTLPGGTGEGDDYYVEVSSSTSPTTTGTGKFTVTTKTTTWQVPSGAANFYVVGSNEVPVTWTYSGTNIATDAFIDLCNDPGKQCTLEASGNIDTYGWYQWHCPVETCAPLFTDITNDGTTEWMVPSSTPLGDDYYFKIKIVCKTVGGGKVDLTCNDISWMSDKFHVYRQCNACPDKHLCLEDVSGGTQCIELGDGNGAAFPVSGNLGQGVQYAGIAFVVFMIEVVFTAVYCVYKRQRHEKGGMQGGCMATYCECGPTIEGDDSFWNKEEARLGRPARPLDSGDMRPECMGGPDKGTRPKRNAKWKPPITGQPYTPPPTARAAASPPVATATPATARVTQTAAVR